MLGELFGELAPAARVLVLVLYAGGAERIAFSRLFHRQLFEALGGGFRFLGKLHTLAGRCAVTAARHHDRAAPLPVREAEVKRRKPAHRKPDDVSLVDLQGIEHSADIVARAFLRVALLIL